MTLVLLLIVFGVVLFLTLYRTKKNQGEISRTPDPPGPFRWPFIGSYLQLLLTDFYRPHIAMMKMKEIYKSPVFGFGMGKFNAVVASDYNSVKEVLTNPDLQGRVPAYPALVRTFNAQNGYFADDGPRWQNMRWHTFRALRDLGLGRRSVPFEQIMEEEGQSLVDFLMKQNSQPVLMPEALFHTMFNLVNHITNGFRYSENDRHILTEMGNVTIRVITGTDATGRLIAIFPWIRHFFPEWSGDTELLETSDYFQKYLQKSLDEHAETADPENDRDIMDFMLRNRSRFPDWDDEEIISSIMDLMFPNASAAAAMTFALAFIAETPGMLKKCQGEIDEVVGRGRLPTLDNRADLKMVEACIRETLRIQPLTPLGLPHRATTDTTLGGYFVPKDSLVITNQYAMNHDPNLFPHPQKFSPERFINGRDATLPFGLGKRVCMGETFARQNMFFIISTILQNFNIEISTPLKPTRYLTGVAEVPNPDFSMRFIPRN